MKHILLPVILCLSDLSMATERIEVLGSRASQFSEQRAEHIEINEEDIENSGASDLSEILEFIPGFRVTQGMRGQTLMIQGLSGKYVKILVNGSPVEGRISGSHDLSRIKLNNVKRIEIIKGPSSSLHGSHAMGGLINIVTKWDRSSMVTLKGRNSSVGKNDFSSSLHQSWEDTQLSLVADHSQSFGYSLEEGREVFKSPKVNDKGLHFQLGTDLTDKNSLALTGDFQSRDIATTEYLATGGIFDRSNDITHTNALVQNDYRYSEAGQVKVKAALSQHKDKYLNDQRGSSAEDSEQFTRQNLETYNVDLSHRFESHELASGLEQSQETFTSERLAENKDYHKQNLAFYLQDRWQISDLLLTFGARQEDDSQFGSHLSKTFAMNYKVNKDSRIVASYSEGFRSPDFKELYMLWINTTANYQVIGNEDLEPEISQYYTVEYRNHAGFLDWNISAFSNEVDNLISFRLLDESIGSTTNTYQYENIERAVIQGSEFEMSYLGSHHYSVKLGHTYMISRNKQTGAYLNDRPINTTKLNALFVLMPSVRMSLLVSHNGKRMQTVQGRQTWLDPYTLARLAGTYDYSDKLSFQLGANNILNEGHPVYLPIEPFHFYFGITADI